MPEYSNIPQLFGRPMALGAGQTPAMDPFYQQSLQVPWSQQASNIMPGNPAGTGSNPWLGVDWGNAASQSQPVFGQLAQTGRFGRHLASAGSGFMTGMGIGGPVGGIVGGALGLGTSLFSGGTQKVPLSQLGRYDPDRRDRTTKERKGEYSEAQRRVKQKLFARMYEMATGEPIDEETMAAWNESLDNQRDEARAESAPGKAFTDALASYYQATGREMPADLNFGASPMQFADPEQQLAYDLNYWGVTSSLPQYGEDGLLHYKGKSDTGSMAREVAARRALIEAAKRDPYIMGY